MSVEVLRPGSAGGSTPVYVRNTDPGAVGAGALWIDTSFSPAQMKTRNAGDTDWNDAGVSGGRIEWHYLDIAFNSADLLTGIPIYTPDSPFGEVITNIGWVSIPTAWDGTTPAGHLFAQGDTPGTDDIASFNPGSADLAVGSNSINFSGAPFPSSPYQAIAPGIPYMISVDDGAGGPCGATMGTAKIALVSFDPTQA